MLGAVFGLVLAVASKVFAVETDERLEPMIEALPGANCGGCGYSGCAAYAQAVLEGKAKIGLCASGGDASAQAMAKIMGIEAAKVERRVAMVMCRGIDDMNCVVGADLLALAATQAADAAALCHGHALGMAVAGDDDIRLIRHRRDHMPGTDRHAAHAADAAICVDKRMPVFQ